MGCGLLRLGEEAAALAERSLSLPLHMIGVLTGHVTAWDQVRLQAPVPLALPGAIRAEASARARAMGAIPRAGLVLRCAAAGEALGVAHEVASALGSRLARVEGEPPRGLAPWLIAAEALPIFMPHPGPGERWALPRPRPVCRPLDRRARNRRRDRRRSSGPAARRLDAPGTAARMNARCSGGRRDSSAVESEQGGDEFPARRRANRGGGGARAHRRGAGGTRGPGLA